MRSLLIQPVLFHIKSFLKDCDDTSECLYVLCFSNLQKAMTRVALWPSVKSTKKCQSPEPKPRKHCMFASYEVATSFPSLTAIKGYDLDKSSDVPLMGHEKRCPWVATKYFSRREMPLGGIKNHGLINRNMLSR